MQQLFVQNCAPTVNKISRYDKCWYCISNCISNWRQYSYRRGGRVKNCIFSTKKDNDSIISSTFENYMKKWSYAACSVCIWCRAANYGKTPLLAREKNISHNLARWEVHSKQQSPQTASSRQYDWLPLVSIYCFLLCIRSLVWRAPGIRTPVRVSTRTEHEVRNSRQIFQLHSTGRWSLVAGHTHKSRHHHHHAVFDLTGPPLWGGG